jgi:serine/threonine protein kinase
MRSTHKATGHIIAMKTYEKKSLTSEGAVMALHQEIYILATLNHPNIMRLYEVIDSRTHVHLIMELCHGTNLYHILKKRKPEPRLPEREAQHIF